MTQRKEPKKESIYREFHSIWSPLKRTKTIKYDLDKHLLMLDIIETKHKSELNKLVKGKK